MLGVSASRVEFVFGDFVVGSFEASRVFSLCGLNLQVEDLRI